MTGSLLKNKPVWTQKPETVIQEFESDSKTGLSQNNVQSLFKKYGPNALQKKEEKKAWQIFVQQFNSVLVWLLLIATCVSYFFGDFLEGSAILAVVLINAIIGFFTEIQAVRSMEALYALTEVTTQVIRDGSIKVILSENVVPGDIIVLEAGDVVVADMRLVEASKLQVDESSLTGESLPVEKEILSVKEETPLAERSCMLYKGTAVTRGSAKAVVVGTGLNTELGNITKLVEEAKEEVTPLEKRLETLGKKLVYVMLVIAAIVAVTGILRGRDIVLMIETAIALAVATVPEGLPIVATIALARGMWRMAKRHALVNKLSSVETLGSTTVIFTDKTGTLTENKMTVTEMKTSDHYIQVSNKGFECNGEILKVTEIRDLQKILEVSVLCNNAQPRLESGKYLGDPMERALLVVGDMGGIKKADYQELYPEIIQDSFDPTIKMMATYNKKNPDLLVNVKGAPESVLDKCDRVLINGKVKPFDQDQKKKWIEWNNQRAELGLRMLGFAYKEVADSKTEPYSRLIFIGIMGFMDPPREEVKESIEKCAKAGIQVIMVTGDQAATAKNVAQTLGIIKQGHSLVKEGKEILHLSDMTHEQIQKIKQASLFARVAPEQKLDLIEIFQSSGDIVAMTGDGVNDGPALKKADIGIAMGKRGTQVAKEASDMILQDDNFVSIADAVEQGRVIFDNIRAFVIYLFSCNLSELLVIFLAALINIPLPILPLQILFLNMVTDVFPALALGVNKGSPSIMIQPPRKSSESILMRKHWVEITLYGLVLTATVLGAFALGSYQYGMYIDGESNPQVVTISFLTLALAQLFHVFNMRKKDSNVFCNEITENLFVWLAVGFCFLLLLIAIYTPLSIVLHTVDPGAIGWGIVFVMSFVPCVVLQLLKKFSYVE